MKIFLATARADDVSWGVTHGMLDGVLTTPGLLSHEGVSDSRAHLLELCRLVQGPIYAAVQQIDAGGAYRDGKDLARLSDQIVVQVPLVEETLGAMRRLRAEGVRVAATHVFNAAQAILAARAGASSVVTTVDELDASGHDGVAVIRAIRCALDASHAECDVVAVHPSSPAQFGACADAGADVVALTWQRCRDLLVHPLTERGVDQYLDEVARLRHTWPAS